jgi:hypothetical protein|tara:strand:- start:379 stop:582 length:204 start_codon:yes stop_codon:yes gene_type:complete
MKLTKYQKARLLEHEWDVVQAKDEGNTSWIAIQPEDGEVYQVALDVFKLTDTGKDIKLLVIGTQNEG